MAGFSPDGRRVVTASWDGTARVWASDSGEPVTPFLRHHAAVRSAGFSPQGARLVTASDDGTAVVWDVASGEPVAAPLRHAAAVFCAGFDTSGRHVLTASKDGTAGLWDAATGKPATPPLRHSGPVNYAEFSRDGRYVVTASSDHTARVWHADSGLAATAPLQHQGEVHRARFSPDGTRIVTASHDGTARIWDPATGQLVSVLTGHHHWVWSAAFSPDGTRIVTASEDGAARVWSVPHGLPVSEPLLHERFLRVAEFSPDGRRIVTAAAEGLARIWELPQPEAGAAARLPQWAVALGGRRWQTGEALEPAPLHALQDLRSALCSPRESGVDPWLVWLLADRDTRPIAPAASLSLPEWRERQLVTGSLYALLSVLLRAPDDGSATARLALHYGSLPAVERDRCYPDPAWLVARARQSMPDAPELRQAEAMLAQANSRRHSNTNESGAQEAVAAACARGRALLMDNQPGEALALLEPIMRQSHPAGQPRELLLIWTESLRQLGRFSEAARELERALGIPPRPEAAGPEAIDLSAHYNAGLAGNWHGDQLDNDLAQLPTGLRLLNQVPFDVRGLIQLRRGGRPDTVAYPIAVNRIPVNRLCLNLHALHSAIHGDTTPGTVVGAYILHYADGERRSLPLVLGRQLADWWAVPGSSANLPEATLAWQGTNGKSRLQGMVIRLFHTTWANPRPDVPLVAIDFTSALSPAAPFLVALTVQ